jgi:hypothetical protein
MIKVMPRLWIATALMVGVFAGPGSAAACVDDTECDDQNVCTTDSCTPASVCANTPLLNGSSCSDGNFCNGAESCQGGTCYPGYPVNVNDSNPCTIDGCHPITGGTHEIVANGTPCPDADTCDGEETCQDGTCTPGTAVCSPECVGPENECLQAVPVLSAPGLLTLAALLMLAAMGRRAGTVRVVARQRR